MTGEVVDMSSRRPLTGDIWSEVRLAEANWAALRARADRYPTDENEKAAQEAFARWANLQARLPKFSGGGDAA